MVWKKFWSKNFLISKPNIRSLKDKSGAKVFTATFQEQMNQLSTKHEHSNNKEKRNKHCMCSKNSAFVTLAIWDASRDLVPFVKFENVKTLMEECYF